MKGVILAGGRGTRLRPATNIINKHLLPILNEPMILYPIRTLKEMGIEDILLVTGGNHLGSFADFLGDGSEYGVNITYKVQNEAGGIAEALLLAEGFVDDLFTVILGDNIFFENQDAPDKPSIYLKEVDDPHRFGVYYNGTIEEKPENPKSNKVVTGLYAYTTEVFDYIRTLEPSARGELEITDVNNHFDVEPKEVKGFWSDAGTPESLKRVIEQL